jgi:DNA-binding GntR family transcriptional regulator
MNPGAIAAELRAELLSGQRLPGSELQQEELAARFGVSRIPVRDALRLLSEEGLVRIEPHRGARVVQLGREEIDELFHLRILLECDCLAAAARAGLADRLERIDRVRRKADMDAGAPEWADGDWAFHAALYAPSGRPMQIELIRKLRQTCRLFVAAYGSLPMLTPRWLDEHSRIVEALRAGDDDGAVEILRAHLTSARDHLLAQMDRS